VEEERPAVVEEPRRVLQPPAGVEEFGLARELDAEPDIALGRQELDDTVAQWKRLTTRSVTPADARRPITRSIIAPPTSTSAFGTRR
jgi:hypothetical protein